MFCHFNCHFCTKKICTLDADLVFTAFVRCRCQRSCLTSKSDELDFAGAKVQQILDMHKKIFKKKLMKNAGALAYMKKKQ